MSIAHAIVTLAGVDYALAVAITTATLISRRSQP